MPYIFELKYFREIIEEFGEIICYLCDTYMASSITDR
jgi:hypothetical protein